jgi:hypothetical protein
MNMTRPQLGGCCPGDTECCTPTSLLKPIKIDFLYLDLSVCERCQGTGKNLNDAIALLKPVLAEAGYLITLNKINVTSTALAIRHAFLSSPTIRVSGLDIEFEVLENNCQSCGDLCGDSVACRVFRYEGKDYNEPPKAMIINAILKGIYAPESLKRNDRKYVLPDNLRTYYSGLDKKSGQ